MAEYTTTIGLEIHAELKTASKMWCGCKNDPEEKKPNTNVCPVCMAHPGTLPVANKGAIKEVIRVGLALGSKIADFTEFDRKNYFYPDIPKGYQLSQYKLPIVLGGSLNGVAITRVHLEEDTAKSTHDKGDTTLVDFNRSGVPLMELVTEPVVKSAKEAGDFARELQRLLRYLGAGEANMEKGQMRVEANISVSKEPGKYGTKVEVKNINSFRSVERAIEYEVERQIGVLENGGKIVQETRGWDENKQETWSQRKKESSHDYRYFPDPDLPKFYLSEIPEFNLEKLKKELPELPWQKRERYVKDFELKPEFVEFFLNDPAAADYFESVIKGKDKTFILLAANYLVSDISGLLKKAGREFSVEVLPDPTYFRELVTMIEKNLLSSRSGKDILSILVEDTLSQKPLKNPQIIAEEKGLLQKTDEGALKQIVEKVISANASVAAEYKSGKENALQFLIGQCMKEAKGSGNPGIFMKLLKENLS